MSKMVKELITGALRSRYAGLDSALLVEFVGIDGNTNNDFRRELRGNEMRLEIINNALFRRATAKTNLTPLHEDLQGPSALLTGGESVIDIAKILEEWKKKLPGVKLKSAVLEGEYVGADRIGRLHEMPNKAQMQSRIAGAIAGPGGKLAGAIRSGGGNIAGCLKAVIEKLEKGEEIKAA